MLSAFIAKPLGKLVVGGIVAGVSQHLAEQAGVYDLVKTPINFGKRMLGIRDGGAPLVVTPAPAQVRALPAPTVGEAAHDCDGSCELGSVHACGPCAAKGIAAGVAGVSPKGGNVGVSLSDVVAYGQGSAAQKAQADREAAAAKAAAEKAADRAALKAIKDQLDASAKATAAALAKLKADMKPKLAFGAPTAAQVAETAAKAAQAAQLSEQMNALRDMAAKILEKSAEGEAQRAAIAAQSQGNPSFLNDILKELLLSRLAPPPAAPAQQQAPQMPYNPYGYPPPWAQMPMAPQAMFAPNYDSTAFLPQMDPGAFQQPLPMADMEVADFYGNQVNGIEDPLSLLSGSARDNEYAELSGFMTNGAGDEETPNVGSYSFADSAIPNLSDTNNLGDAHGEGDDASATEAAGFWPDGDNNGISRLGEVDDELDQADRDELDDMAGVTDDTLLGDAWNDEDGGDDVLDSVDGFDDLSGDDDDAVEGFDDLSGMGDGFEITDVGDSGDDFDAGDEEGADCRIGGMCGVY